jgi:arylsulfatase A-like enzyme
VQSTADQVSWEEPFKGETTTTFPHNMPVIYPQDPVSLRSSPSGNTLTLDFAKAAIAGYNLGGGAVTDFLTINCASTDYVGHQYGPNSIEIEDTYLRLDKDLSAFFRYLDQRLGKGNYLVFLSADHGVAHSIGFMKEHNIPAELFPGGKLMAGLDSALAVRFGVNKLIVSGENYHINFDRNKIKQQHLDFDAVKKEAVMYLQQQPGIQFAVDIDNIGNSPVPEPVKSMIINGYNPKRCGPVMVIQDPGWFQGSEKGTTHGSWNTFDTHLPLLFMGWHVKHGATNATVSMTDIAPTIAAMLHIQMPSGSVGKPVMEVYK